MKFIEQEWRKNQPRLSKRELLKIFPEGQPILKKKLEECQNESQSLSKEIEKDLRKIYKQIEDSFSVWFWEKYIEIFRGERLDKLEVKIRKLKWEISPVGKIRKNEITDRMIQRAREYPFENLIEFNRAKKTLCVFHSEKHPSLSLNPKTNRIKCFGCGINYDTIEYIIKTQNLSFVEAVKYLNH